MFTLVWAGLMGWRSTPGPAVAGTTITPEPEEVRGKIGSQTLLSPGVIESATWQQLWPMLKGHNIWQVAHHGRSPSKNYPKFSLYLSFDLLLVPLVGQIQLVLGVKYMEVIIPKYSPLGQNTGKEEWRVN